MTAPTRFSSGLSTNPDVASAASEVCDAIVEQYIGTENEPPTFVVIFFSADLNSQADVICDTIRQQLNPQRVIGCCGESIIGNGREVENATAISALAGFGFDDVISMHLQFERSSDGSAIVGWPDGFDGRLSADSRMIVLADPFTFPADMLLERMNEDWPGMLMSGGVASGCPSPGDARLLMDDRVLQEGAVALHIPAADGLRTVVSQGCRPIGEPMVVTQSDGNEVQHLGGKPALLQLKEMFDRLPTSDQQRVQSALQIGRVVNEYQDDFEQGDFLIRNVVGIDADTGYITVADFFRTGQTVQFQIRDEQSADGEMSAMLATAAKQPASAALLFSCNGRGSRMFSVQDHDAGLIKSKLGDIPLAGFFAAGEIGPVAGKNYLHGFTASMLLFGD